MFRECCALNESYSPRDNELGLETGSGLADLLAVNSGLSCLDMSENPLLGSIGVEALSRGLQVFLGTSVRLLIRGEGAMPH